MKQHIRIAVVLVLSGILVGCSTPSPQPDSHPRQQIGGEHDAHGCIAAAGYRWCNREKACVRSWELAAQAGIPSDAESFRQYCDSMGP